jgi:hypothetical protein
MQSVFAAFANQEPRAGTVLVDRIGLEHVRISNAQPLRKHRAPAANDLLRTRVKEAVPELAGETLEEAWKAALLARRRSACTSWR